MSSQEPSLSEKSATWGELLRGRNALRSLTLVGGVALYAINMYIVTTILPNIVADIGGLAYYAWNTTLFVMASIVGSVLIGKLVTRYGPKRSYLLALALFALGSAWCAAAFSMWFLLMGRALQGLGGGMLFSLGYVLIRVVFEQHLWTRATALVSAMWGIATLLGPTVGGFFAQGGHWRWAFGSLLPISLVLSWVVSLQIAGKSSSTSHQSESSKTPVLALLLLVGSVLAISLASLNNDTMWNVVMLGSGLLLLLAMMWTDSKATENRLLPSGSYQLKNPRCQVYLIMILLIMGMTTEIFVPYFLQLIHNMSPLGAGYMTAFMSAGWTLSSLPSAAKTGLVAKKLMRAGPIVVAISLWVLAVLMPKTGLDDMVLMTVYGLALAGIGFGIGLVWPHLLTWVLVSAPKGQEAVSSSSITTVQLYGTALAAALAGVVANQAGLVSIGGVAGAKMAAWWLFAVFGMAPILAIVLVWQLLRK